MEQARKQPGELVGLTHGRLVDYIRGCRCAECQQANRDAARAHRQRVKNGTAARHVPPKSPKSSTEKTYQGAPALTEEWEVLGQHTDADGVQWLISLHDADADGWRKVKVASRGRAKHKANYWGSCRVDGDDVVMGRGKDIRETMRGNRPTLWRATTALLDLWARQNAAGRSENAERTLDSLMDSGYDL